MSTHELLGCQAPAKLNLFLHIVGRRPDGYHQLQTVFQLIDWCDYLDFYRRNDGHIHRTPTIDSLTQDNDLIIRAAKLLQSYSGCHYGADIRLNKQLPMGSGLGGGSSDAATTLLALNHLWDLHLPREQLISMGLQLGADVPFFLFGQNAFAQGIGEQLEAFTLPSQWFVVLHPPVHVSTAEIFSDPTLTRDTEPVKIADFTTGGNAFLFGHNDLQKVVLKKYPEVALALDWLSVYAKAKMTGSGACVFASFDNHILAHQVLDMLPQGWQGRCVRGLHEHPLKMFAV
jgi:4-diphosphocytidyl-2-C-methyl-D-erythritol kinase